tara:strand:+ start:590 stop:1042 length:453 start_codon:yes stop_codon:yes gene_type:complete
MLLNITWLIPGIPIIASSFITVLLLSFEKTINRLTKPISYFLIVSLMFSEIIDFVLFRKNISGNYPLFGTNLDLVVDRPAILFAESIGLVFLLIMLLSVAKLQRRNGYVRYFISLGFFSGFLYFFSFSGIPFHNFYDLLVSSLDKIGISF